MNPVKNYHPKFQSGFTLIETMMIVAIIGILASIATVSYQKKIRQTQLITIYQESNQYRMPYQILIDEGAGVMGFSPSGLNMPAQTKYCHFSVTAPVLIGVTTDAVKCTIQNLSYLQGQSLSLDRTTDGNWQCRASAGISTVYLPNGCR